MREIKFRAWEKSKKIMHNDLFDIPNCEMWFNDAGSVVMQYTGLKDKNGVEIYEGDIVKLPYIDPFGGVNYDVKNERDYLAEVIYLRGCFRLNRNYVPEPIDIDGWFGKKQGKYISNYGNLTIYDESPIFEVIGNIYENPELLEQSNIKENE